MRLVDKIVGYMESKDYQIFKSPGKKNIVYVEGMNQDGTLNDDRPNWFNDIRCVFEYIDGKPEIVGLYGATTEPGSYYTYNPMNPKGCARIAFGQYKSAWQVGSHGYSDPHEALVQVGNVTVCRDLNQDFSRIGDVTETGDWFGCNQHWAGDASEDDIGLWSAGCLVGRSRKSHRKFMSLVKSDPDYQNDWGYRFTTTLIPGDKLIEMFPD